MLLRFCHLSPAIVLAEICRRAKSRRAACGMRQRWLPRRQSQIGAHTKVKRQPLKFTLRLIVNGIMMESARGVGERGSGAAGGSSWRSCQVGACAIDQVCVSVCECVRVCECVFCCSNCVSKLCALWLGNFEKLFTNLYYMFIVWLLIVLYQ